MASFVFDPAPSRTEHQQPASREQGRGAASGRTPPEEGLRRPALLRYGVAVAAVIMVFLLRLLLPPLREAGTPLLLCVAAVATSAWYGGLRPGLLTAALATLLSHDHDALLTPSTVFANSSPGQGIRLALFALDALVITWLSARLHATHDQAQARARTAAEAEWLVQTLLEYVPDGMTIAAGPPDFPIIASSRSALEFLGRSQASVIGVPAGDPSTADGLVRATGVSPTPREQLPLYRVSHLGETVTDEEWVIQRVDGEPITLLAQATPLCDGQGRVLGAIDCWRDITALKQTETAQRCLAALVLEHTRLSQAAQAALQETNAALERQIQERTALLQLLYDVAVMANTASTPEEALQQALDRICAATGWLVGHVYLRAADATGAWVPTALWHLDDPRRFAAFQHATQTTRLAPEEGLIGRVGVSGQPEWGADVATNPAFLRRQAAAAVHLTTGYIVPLLIQQEVVGVLEFYTDTMRTPDAALLNALRQVGLHLGRVIERQRTSEHVQRQQEALAQQEKMAAMSALLASVAYALHHPLATIVLHAELLREDVCGGPLAEPVAEIAQAVACCERLARQCLTLARQHPPERAAVSLNTLVTETVELLAYPCQVDNTVVHVRLDDQLPLIWEDLHQWQQVLLNLLTNAQQALQDAPGPRQITLSTQYDPTQPQITLAVTDTGPGIPLALQAHIFEPFLTTKPLGMGLGLSLCRRIVKAHGGTLQVSSTPGQGATFQVMLPVQTVPAPAPTIPSAAEGSAMRGLTILLVDDERSLARGLARLLGRDGHTVDMAANGRLALAKLDERAYDLILSDIRMPELDGPGLYRLLERQQAHLCQRFIFLTGDTLEPATRAFLEESGAPCLTKPFTLAQARHAIQRAIGQG